MVLGTAIPAAFAANAQPNDVSGNKYQTAIDTLTSMGTLPLYSDGSFRPDLTVSRGQAIAYLFNVASKIGTDGNNPMPVYTLKQQPFTDENSFFRNEINNMYLAGYLNNVDLGNGAIGQNYKTPTWWFAQVLCNIAGVSYDSGKTYDALNQARAQGWFDNTDDKTANPNYYLSRGEMAQVMENFFIALDKGAFTGIVTSATLAAANANTGVGLSDALTVTAKDATGATVDLATGNHTVTYNVTSSNAADAAVTSTGNFVATMPGAYTVTATVDGITTDPVTVTVAGVAAGIQLSAASPTIVANGASTDTVTATVVDASGNPVTNFSGTITFGDSANWLAGVTSATVANGVATITVNAPSTAGLSDTVTVSTVTPSNGTALANVSGAVTVSSVAQVASGVTVTPSSPTVADNSATLDNVAVQVVDQAGQPMLWGSFPVNVTLTGPGTVNGVTTYTSAYIGNGGTSSVTVPVYSIQGQGGTITVAASSGSLAQSSATISSVTVGNATALKVALASGSASSFSADSGSTGATFNVTAVDSNGNTVPFSGSNTYTVTDSSGNTMTGMTTLVAGGVKVTGTAAGTYTLTVADAAGVLTSATTQFTITAGAAAKVAVTVPANNVNVSVGSPSVAITAQLEDNFNNPVAAAGDTIEFKAVGANAYTFNGVASSYTATTDSSGMATVKFAGQPTPTSTWTVSTDKLNSSSVSSTNSVTVTMVGLPASSLTVSTTDLGNATTYAKAGDTVTYTVYEKDAYGNPSPNQDMLSVTIPAGLTLLGGSTLSPTSTAGVYQVQLSNTGTTTFQLMAETAGGQTVTLADITNASSNLSTSETETVTPTGQADATLYYGSAPLSSSNTVTVAANTPVALAVMPTDGHGNVALSNSTVNVNLYDPNGGSFRLTPTGASVNEVQLAPGQSSLTVYYVNGTANTYDNMTATEVTALFAVNSGTGVITVTGTGSHFLNGTTTVTVTGAGGAAAAGGATVAGQVVTWTPTGTLAAGTYTVTVSTGSEVFTSTVTK